MKSRLKQFITGAAGMILLLTAIVFLVPSLRDRVINKYDEIRAQIKYSISPPEKVIFSPQEQAVAAVVRQTMTALAPTATFTPQADSSTPQPTLIPTITPTPLPQQVVLDGIKFQTQRSMWNYCAPANLSMALSYWGWEEYILDIGRWLKPYSKDKNVMPYEMQAYVEEVAGLKSVVRVGGDLDTIKVFITNGFPVLIEKSEILHGEYGPGSTGWMGHYMVFNGFDDTRQILIGQDSLTGPDAEFPYSQLKTDWRGFNYIYMVIYPPDQEELVFTLLGEQLDERANYEYAGLLAANEVLGLSGRDQFLAYYNRGTNLVALQDYATAALMYDEAYALYPSIAEEDRPYRATWYQTGPYYAYYFTGRYWDVINLATTTLDAMSEPILEESYYWRARAELALGDTVGAEKDLRLALKYHEDFAPALQLLADMGLDS
jgi:hypothetical protein